ncbi:hypothetical protein DFH09DRAFT_1331121 [Mycena vulgaris]|nr:hypothetical protein DFH09DRAFT_1331121 [Mycena vulgaris]
MLERLVQAQRGYSLLPAKREFCAVGFHQTLPGTSHLHGPTTHSEPGQAPAWRHEYSAHPSQPTSRPPAPTPAPLASHRGEARHSPGASPLPDTGQAFASPRAHDSNLRYIPLAKLVTSSRVSTTPSRDRDAVQVRGVRPPYTQLARAPSPAHLRLLKLVPSALFGRAPFRSASLQERAEMLHRTLRLSPSTTTCREHNPGPTSSSRTRGPCRAPGGEGRTPRCTSDHGRAAARSAQRVTHSPERAPFPPSPETSEHTHYPSERQLPGRTRENTTADRHKRQSRQEVNAMVDAQPWPKVVARSDRERLRKRQPHRKNAVWYPSTPSATACARTPCPNEQESWREENAMVYARSARPRPLPRLLLRPSAPPAGALPVLPS